MKVLHLSNYYPGSHEHAGGAEHAMEWTVRVHAELGIDNVLLTLRPDHREQAGLPHYSARTVESLLPGLRGVVEPVKWYALQADPLAQAKLAHVLRQERVDAVHVGNAQFLTLGLLPLLRVLRIPVILSIYDYWLFCPLTTLVRQEQAVCDRAHGTGCLPCLPAQHRHAQRALLAARPAVMGLLARSVSRFVALSESSSRIAVAHGVPPSRVQVIRLPREPAGSRASAASGRHVLLVGWQQWRKGLHVAVDAWARVAPRFPDARLHLVGGQVQFGEAYASSLQQQVRDLGLEGSVHLHGRVEEAELDRLLQQASLVMVPEQWENMSPLILLRAMELGKAIVASDIGGIPEFVRHEREGLLASPGDAVAHAEGVCRLLADPALGQELGAAAAQRVRRVCAPEVARNAWSALYSELGLHTG